MPNAVVDNGANRTTGGFSRFMDWVNNPSGGLPPATEQAPPEPDPVITIENPAMGRPFTSLHNHMGSGHYGLVTPRGETDPDVGGMIPGVVAMIGHRPTQGPFLERHVERSNRTLGMELYGALGIVHVVGDVAKLIGCGLRQP